MIERVFNKSMDDLGPFEKNPHIAVAVSGGSDSLCLALLSKKWIKKKGGKITALIVDHGLRKNSKKECMELQKVLNKNNIPNYSFKWNSQETSSGLQKKAREFRYNMFEDWCFRNNVFHLLIAHHFDDQKETFFIRLNSDSNIYGLSSMSKVIFRKKIRILRPMLDFNKKEIIRYLKNKRVNWFEDPSNQLLKYTRNKFRKIIPDLEKSGLTNDKLKRIFKFAQNQRHKIENKTTKWLVENVQIDTFGFASINIGSLKDLKKNEFIFIFGRVLTTISGAIYPPKSKYIFNFFKKIKNKKVIKATNLGGCHVFFFKKNNQNKLYVCREIFKKKREKKIDFKFNSFIWDNRFEIAFKKNKSIFLKKNLGKSFFIKQLKMNGWNEIVSRNINLKKNFTKPNKIILSLPAIKNKKDNVLFVPYLNYYLDLKSKKKFSKINFFFKPNIALSNN